MATTRCIAPNALGIVGLCALLLSLAGCRPGQAPGPALTPVSPGAAPAPQPTLSLDQTSANDFVISDFEAVHAPVDGDANKYLIYGNIPVAKPAADLPPELAVLLGRWEGYGDSPSVKKDQKIVMVIQEITAQGGKAVGWSAPISSIPPRSGNSTSGSFRLSPLPLSGSTIHLILARKSPHSLMTAKMIFSGVGSKLTATQLHRRPPGAPSRRNLSTSTRTMPVIWPANASTPRPIEQRAATLRCGVSALPPRRL